MKGNLWIPAVVATVSMLVCSQTMAVDYYVTDLGTLGGSASAALAINNLDQVVGWAYADNGSQRAFIWEDGVMTDLGKTVGTVSSAATGINDSGMICGMGTSSSGKLRALVWDGGPAVDIGTLGGSEAHAQAINESGIVVGVARLGSGVWHPFIYDGSPMTTYTVFSGTHSGAFGVNDAGCSVGDAELSLNGVKNAFLYDPDAGSVVDVGNVGGSLTRASGINELMQICGYGANSSGHDRGFLWDNGTLTIMGTLGGSDSRALAINDAGLVVGWAETGSNEQHAIVFEDGMLIDLNDHIPFNSEWVLCSALGINDVGHIVGWGIIDGEQHAFLLTPVPEPATILLLGTGMVGALGMIRRRGMRG